MTWSIVARDASGALGIAVASRFFAVGALCPHGRAGVGALSLVAMLVFTRVTRSMDARREQAA